MKCETIYFVAGRVSGSHNALNQLSVHPFSSCTNDKILSSVLLFVIHNSALKPGLCSFFGFAIPLTLFVFMG